MLSVIIPTDGVEQPAVATLAALVPGAAAGVVREVLLVDRAGNGVIERVADVAGVNGIPADKTATPPPKSRYCRPFASQSHAPSPRSGARARRP